MKTGATYVSMGVLALLATLPALSDNAGSVKSAELAAYKKGEMRTLRVHPSSLELPIFEFKDAGGETVAIKHLKGKVIVLNLWATWCAPCVKELPALDALQREFPGKDLNVIAVSQDRAGSKVVPPFFDKLKLKNLRIYLDNKSSLMEAFRVSGLPTTIIIDRSGKEVARLVGAVNWASPEAVSLLQAIERRP